MHKSVLAVVFSGILAVVAGVYFMGSDDEVRSPGDAPTVISQSCAETNTCP